jgi:heme exporter protein B
MSAVMLPLPATLRRPGVLHGMRCVFMRDLRAVLRRRTDATAALVFFVIVVSLFPLGVGANPEMLRAMAPGVVWVAALLASMLSLARLFADDHQDGTLEQVLLSATPLPLLALAASLLLGTPLLSLIGGIGAALTVGVRGAGVLLSLLVLPLVVPVLIFGAGAVTASEAGLGSAAHLSLLGAMLALALVLAPLAASGALRIAIE